MAQGRWAAMDEAGLRLVAEPRDGATYVTVLGAGGQRIRTGILARPEDVAAFNALPPRGSAMPLGAHALYLALVQEAQSEHWQGSAADRAWLLHALHDHDPAR